MSLIVLFSILVLSVHNSHCGLPSLGACPSLRGVSDFSVSRYMGRWYGNSNGTARPTEGSPAELIVSFDGVPFSSSSPNYRVGETDYENYAIVYNCKSILGFLKKESLWFLTRSQTPKEAIVSEGYSRMTELGLPVGKLRLTKQDNCQDMP